MKGIPVLHVEADCIARAKDINDGGAPGSANDFEHFSLPAEFSNLTSVVFSGFHVYRATVESGFQLLDQVEMGGDYGYFGYGGRSFFKDGVLDLVARHARLAAVRAFAERAAAIAWDAPALNALISASWSCGGKQ